MFFTNTLFFLFIP